MAQSILIYDFGTNEEAAQQARHKIESWQQGLRLGKKILIKFERKDIAEEVASSVTAEKESVSKPVKKKASAKAEAKSPHKAETDKTEADKDAAPTANVRLMVRLGFSDHEKLIQQRVLDRFTSEEPFKSAKAETIRQGSPTFSESAELFDDLD